MASDDVGRAWERVLARLEKMLITGEIGPGQRLPSERQLTAELGVARSSVREALRVMEAMGLLRTQTGSGPNAGATVIAAPSSGMTTLLRMQVAAQHFPVADIVHTRIVLESAAVRELAHHPERSLADAVKLLDAMDEPSLSPSQFLALDARFHLELAEAAGNAVIATMMSALRDSIEAYFVARAPSARWQDTSRHLQCEHRELIASVSDGDADTAEQKIVSHIVGYYEGEFHSDSISHAR